MRTSPMFRGILVSLSLISGSALAQGNWSITNGGVGAFAGWAATSGVLPLAGDFNGDGRDDIALVRRTAGWNTVPVAFGGTTPWSLITNAGVGVFAGWAATSGVLPLVGDFDGDRRDDIALLRQTAGWSTIPVAFARN
jgi:serralysin